MTFRSFLRRLQYNFLRGSIRMTAVFWFQIRYFGRQNIPATGPILVVSNHQSHLDPPLVGAGSNRPLNYLARKTLFDIPLFGKWIPTLNVIPIDREGVALAGIKESLRRLKRGEGLVLFPEGTRSPDGEVHPFRPGFTVLAVRTGATIVPMAIEGAFEAWPRWRWFPRFQRIHVCYGKPILPEEMARYDERGLLAEVERRVRACHAQLLTHPDFADRPLRQ